MAIGVPFFFAEPDGLVSEAEMKYWHCTRTIQDSQELGGEWAPRIAKKGLFT